MGKTAVYIRVTSNFLSFSRAISFFIAFLILISSASSQQEAAGSRPDSIFNKLDPQQWSAAIEKKVTKLEEKIIAKSEKMLRKLQKEEEKIYRKLLTSKDSLAAKTQLEEIRNRYTALQQKLKNPSSLVSAANVKDYTPWLDTASTALKFLDQQGVAGNIKNALSKVESLNGRLQQADEIKRFIRERKEQLRQKLENLGLVKELKKFSKEIFYYAQTIREYKEILKDPKKIERKAIGLLSKTKLFQDFMRKHSMLASLFRMPGDPNDPNYVASLAGLQTRTQVNTLIQNQLTAGGPNAQAQFSQNIQAAQTQLQQLKDKVNKWGGSSSDEIMPEGFKPNNQKTKSIWQRIELGTNIQSQRSTNFYPVTSDVGLSLGYKLNEKSVIGVGASYKMGWGSGWNNIRITHQGVGLRSYIDWKLKGSFWISGGYEQNYKPSLRSLIIPSPFGGSRMGAAWQHSGLIGLSKIVSVKSKMFKKTKVQLLWDFLSYSQKPRTQSLIFRIGYSFK
jgi:hypothetical protein